MAFTTALESDATLPVTVKLSDAEFFKSASNITVWLPEKESSCVFSVFLSAVSISADELRESGTGGVAFAVSCVSGAAQAGAVINAVIKQAMQSFLPN